MMTQGTLVDATIIEGPARPEQKQQRDPQMHQTKKGNQWHFGMKAHIGVDARWPDPQPSHHRGQRGMTSISWVICCMEGNLSQPMPATKGRHSARSWPRWMWTG